MHFTKLKMLSNVNKQETKGKTKEFPRNWKKTNTTYKEQKIQQYLKKISPLPKSGNDFTFLCRIKQPFWIYNINL